MSPKTDDDLHKIATLAKAVTPGPTDEQLDEWLRECVGPLLYQREGAIRMALIKALIQQRMVASPDVVRELIDRVLNAEAIVRLLADTDPLADGGCFSCGTNLWTPNGHKPTCVWRRAIETQS